MDFHRLTIDAIRSGLAKKTFSASDIVAASLQRIEATDKKLGAFLKIRTSVTDEAARIDERLAHGGDIRPLEGVPIAVKSNIAITGEPLTAGSKILEPYHAVYSATVVARLQQAGALIVGLTNQDEFAMGSSTENSAFQPTKNPWDVSRVPGGSSGGSAVAVAAGDVVASLGSDTGGSIRQPAAFCSVIGFKPTYGRVSRNGLVALASSLDQIGPFTKSVEDAATMFQVMAGQDEFDATSLATPVDDPRGRLATNVKGLRIGLPEEFFGPGVDPDVASTIRQAAEVYATLGAEIVSVSVPMAAAALATYYIILPAEASSNLARYDGIRYGLSARETKGLLDVYERTRDRGFGSEPKRRIMIGTYVLSAGQADAYYYQARRVQAALREDFHRVFDTVDVLLTPTTPTTAFKLGEKVADPLAMYLADLLTVPANLAGIPAISVPAGFVGGLPVGMQLMARSSGEATLFQAAAAYERETDWSATMPEVE